MTGIVEVARRAGVSVSTASRAINGHSRVSRGTTERVRKAALELGYVRSSSAYTLATGQNRNIGVILPYVDQWYFTSILASVEAHLIAAGFDLTLYNLNGGPNQRKQIFSEFLLRRRVDSVLTIALKLTPEELETLRRLGKPVVAIGGPIEGAPTIGIDDFGAAKLATQHLISLGHRSVVFIGSDPDHQGDFYHPAIRYDGYCAAMVQAGLEVGESSFVPADLTLPGGYAAAKHVLSDPRVDCSGIVAATDEMAFGALLAVRDLGLRVPEDISVVGIDGHDLAEFFGLTTVNQEARAQGTRAAQLVLDLVQGVTIDSNLALKWPIRLQIRSSTRAR
jgi:LacI family repressor for deo operon, udp, cdd, tsx, nupC, and nupG